MDIIITNLIYKTFNYVNHKRWKILVEAKKSVLKHKMFVMRLKSWTSWLQLAFKYPKYPIELYLNRFRNIKEILIDLEVGLITIQFSISFKDSQS